MLSRNFRLQRVGNLDWLQRNYDFSHIAFYIDELVVLDVTRGERSLDLFCDALKSIASNCFAPIAAGGGVRSVDHARQLLRSGADKVVVNTSLFEDPEVIIKIVNEFGQQCVVGSVDVKRVSQFDYNIYTNSGRSLLAMPFSEALIEIFNRQIGELYLNSIDQDGTGNGYDFAMLDQLPDNCQVPVILAGGVGNGRHLSMGLDDPRVDAVATANLFNFVRDGLKKARADLVTEGKNLAVWVSPNQKI